ncbi:hypothetical protein ACRALDRAFT_1081165 [Sodiomyces alcalophilus JCM 7366]|uniref:uncharacterized protein n=1 Tax=Sodiomyces alcalophilus JCM 7366 TaxID=591952 RepID=UPI0039B62D53
MSMVRLPLRETMDNATASPETESTSRRRSGRVVRAPEKYSPEVLTTSKRKRGADADDEDHEIDDEDDDNDNDENEAPDTDDDMSDATDTYVAGRSRRSTSRSKRSHKGPAVKKKPAAKKPAVKKPKTNGVASKSLGHASALPSRPKKKTVAIANLGRPGEGDLYVDVFSSAETVDRIAEQWLQKYHTDDAPAVRDLVNFVLRSCGCELEVTEDDIRDPDNSDSRLTELQEIYQEERITEYPLISRAKGTKSFRELFTDFFHSFVAVLHETDVLYKDTALMENVSRWIASMSTSSLRPFRHTATTAILSLVTGLVEVAKTLDARIAGIEQQIAAGQRGKNQANKAKLSEMQRNLDQANAYREQCSELITDFFDTTFVHRYRDIDSRIRTECVEALGHWIIQLPTVFMEPGYLRYLGWMLSDAVASTRLEVLKQLGRIFKRDAEQLGHFIDRFRPRLIEIATKDAEVSVRVAAISVVDTLRAAGMLDPDEVDSISRLIFDSELRVRKAAANFFEACVQELLSGRLEELGGSEVLDEVFGGTEEDDFESPREEWVSIKCLAENLAAYDAQVEQEHGSPESHDPPTAVDILQAVTPTTRISMAAQVLFDKMPVVSRWELLAGYLVYDHSTSAKSKSEAPSPDETVKMALGPDGNEEAILLEVMASAVTVALSQPTERKGGRHEAVDTQEDIALELATLIPRLLNKFGADPATAKIILRMEHVLKLDVFQQLRQDSARYEKLLDEVATQFSRHDDKEVLAEATAALSHARQHEELEELTDGKLSLLWENAINSLRNFDKTCELSERGQLAEEHLTNLSTILTKISNLASVSDCTDVLETEGQAADSPSASIEILTGIVQRGTFTHIDDGIDDLEDEVVSFAIKACQFYYMWKLHNLEKMIQAGLDIPDSVVNQLQKLSRTFVDNLINTLSSRVIIDDIRLYATCSLCDVHIIFGSLRDWVRSSPQSAKYKKLASILQEIPPGLVPELISIFDGVERSFAKRTKKTLNEPADDEDPIDDESSDDEDEDEGLTREQRFVNELKAERSLCELAGKYVMAISRKVLDQSGPTRGRLRRRLLRNQTRLGKNFQEVVAFLDESKVEQLLYGKKSKTRSAANRQATAASKKPAQSEVVVAEEESDHHEDEDPFKEPEPEEGSREDLRRRELLEDEQDEEDDGDDASEGADADKGGGDESGPDNDSVLGD